MARALADGDLDGWAVADAEFHRHLVELSGNRHLVDTAARFFDLVHRARLATLRLRPLPTESVDDHAALVEAVLAGDGARAHGLHLAHRRRIAAELVDLLRRNDLAAV